MTPLGAFVGIFSNRANESRQSLVFSSRRMLRCETWTTFNDNLVWAGRFEKCTGDYGRR